MRQINGIVIHCSATPDGDERFTAERIKEMHLAQGWKNIGYHYVIEIDGTTVRGRPEYVVGSHVKGHNADTIGICMIGTKRFTLQQWASLASLLLDIRHRHKNKLWVTGHRNLSPDKDRNGIVTKDEWTKQCPGFDVEEWLIHGIPKGGVI